MINYSTSIIAGRDFGVNFQPNLEDCPPHTHSYIELAFTLSGQALHTLNGVKTTLNAGEYVIVNPGDVHGYEITGSEPYSVINCIFNAKFVYSSASANTFEECLLNPLLNYNSNNFTRPTSGYVIHNPAPSIRGLFMLLKEEYEKKEYKYRTICRNILNIILIYSARNFSQISQSTFLLSEYMKDYVSMHYAEENLLQKMSNEINYSVPYMSSKFKKDTGVTFKTFLQTTRIDAAVSLLNETKMSIPEIAAAVGYKDIKHFYSTFKKIKNSTPSQHRGSKQS